VAQSCRRGDPETRCWLLALPARLQARRRASLGPVVLRLLDLVNDLMDGCANPVEVLTQLAPLLPALSVAPTPQFRLNKLERLLMWAITPRQEHGTAVVAGPEGMLLTGAVLSAGAHDGRL